MNIHTGTLTRTALSGLAIGALATTLVACGNDAETVARSNADPAPAETQIAVPDQPAAASEPAPAQDDSTPSGGRQDAQPDNPGETPALLRAASTALDNVSGSTVTSIDRNVTTWKSTW